MNPYSRAVCPNIRPLRIPAEDRKFIALQLLGRAHSKQLDLNKSLRKNKLSPERETAIRNSIERLHRMVTQYFLD